jgi:hypothetical protein
MPFAADRWLALAQRHLGFRDGVSPQIEVRDNPAAETDELIEKAVEILSTMTAANNGCLERSREVP